MTLPPSLALFDARILRPMVVFLGDHGAPAEKYLDSQRIPVETVLSGGWIAKKQAYEFVHEIIKREVTHDIVFSAYDRFQLDDLGPIAPAICSCRTVKEALELTTQLGCSAFEGNRYFLEIEGETTWLAYREPVQISDGQDWINDMTLAVYRRLITLLASDEWHPERMRTQGPRFERHKGLDAFVDCQVVGAARNTGIAFPTEFLSRKIEFGALNYESVRCDDWEMGPESECAFMNGLHRLLYTRINHSHPPTLQEVARLASVSNSTFKRQLSRLGVTYRSLLDRVRFDKAEQLLITSDLSVDEIAAELGYSGANNFIRAFRRMTATTPAEYRSRKRESI